MAAAGLSLELLRNILGFSGTAGLWKFLALLFALINLKTLPLAWHVSGPSSSSQYIPHTDNPTDTPHRGSTPTNTLLTYPPCRQSRPLCPLSTHHHIISLTVSGMRL